jgi:hypothetical protein
MADLNLPAAKTQFLKANPALSGTILQRRSVRAI